MRIERFKGVLLSALTVASLVVPIVLFPSVSQAGVRGELRRGPAGTVTREGKYIIVEAPSEYIPHLENNLDIFDDEYEALLELTGLAPYDGGKITIFFDSSIESATAYAGNPIRVGKGFWDEFKGRGGGAYLLGHELSHVFTLQQPFDIIFPFDAFTEGWAQFARQWILLQVFPNYFTSSDGYYQLHYNGVTSLVPTYEKFKEDYLYPALDEYISTGCDFNKMTPGVAPNAAAGMMQEIADTHGWDTYKELFRALLSAEHVTLPTLEEKCSIFVYYLSLASGTDLVPLFKDEWGFPTEYWTPPPPNQPPTAPSSPYCEGETNPTAVTDLTPEFSAVYEDPDAGDKTIYYEIEVDTSPDFTGIRMWDTGKISMVALSKGNKCPDII